MRLKYLLVILTSSFISLFVNCSTVSYVTVNDLCSGKAGDNTVCIINTVWDLNGDTVYLPHNCTIVFKKGGIVKNGSIIGDDSKIKHTGPFVGNNVVFIGCTMSDRGVIRDEDVFERVTHTQREIQTLFDISGGERIQFTHGVYENIDRININRDVDADFNNSIIKLTRDTSHVSECFYMEPWIDKSIEYIKLKNLSIIGYDYNYPVNIPSGRCIQFFNVSVVELNNISIDRYFGGPYEYRSDASDLLDKTRIGTCVVAIMNYNRCIINNCKANNINKEIFWCVPNNNPNNITYFTNNFSTCTYKNGSSSFFTLLDGRCVVKNNEVHNYNGSAFNVFCYDSDISFNKFYDGKGSIAIDLSEGEMYQANNVYVHHNQCINTKGLVAAYGNDIRITNNSWLNKEVQHGDRIIIVTIVSRQGRKEDGKYIGCDNNQETGLGVKNIVIDNNICINEAHEKKSEIRFACVYGDNISILNNKLTNLNVPVVQLVEGTGFVFQHNCISETKEGYYSELLINECEDINVTNNTFSRNYIERDFYYTVRVINAGGHLIYKDNIIRDDTLNNVKNKFFVPCYVQKYNNLREADYYVNKTENDMKVESRIDNNKVILRTNIRH